MLTAGSRISRRSALGLAAGGLAGACAGTRDPARLEVWAMSTEGENLPALLPRFTAATGIGVDVQSMPWTAGHEKLLTAFAGGSLPDLVMLTNTWVAEFAQIGAIVPVPPAARGLLADQLAGVLDGVRVGGRDFAVPWTIGAQAQFYRRDLLAAAGHAAPPLRWDEWKATGHALKRRNPDGYAALMLLDWPEHLFNFAAQQPEPLLRDRWSRGNFSSAGFRAVLAFYKSIFDEGLAPRMLGTDVADAIGAFGRGWFALYPAPPYLVGDLRLRAADVPRDLWGVSLLPGPHGAGAGAVGGNSLAVTCAARDPARAWSLIRFLTAPDTQLRLHALVGDLPTRPSAWAAPVLARDPVAGTFGAQVRRGVSLPNVPEWARIQTEVQLVAERMVRGAFGVDAAAAEMDRRVDALLAKRRWLLDRGRTA